jgi:hypothetical protein
LGIGTAQSRTPAAATLSTTGDTDLLTSDLNSRTADHRSHAAHSAPKRSIRARHHPLSAIDRLLSQHCDCGLTCPNMLVGATLAL